MPMTITEKILAIHSRRDKVEPGQTVWVSVDLLMTHDVCGPGTFGIFRERFGGQAGVFDPAKLVVIPDHYIFTQDEKARRNVEILRQFAREQKLPYFYDVGGPDYRGVCHVTLPYEGHCRPGEIILGTDSHTCTHGAFGAFAAGIGNTEAAFVLGTGRKWLKVPPTMLFRLDGQLPPYLMAKDCILHILGEIGVEGANYRTMEFIGQTVGEIDMDERMTLCNMTVEGGAKNGIIPPDAKTDAFVKARTSIPFEPIDDDPGAGFLSVKNYDVAKWEPAVAKPHSPANLALARDLKDEKIDQVYIGSCTGGKLTDFVRAAEILSGNTVSVKTYIVPSTTFVVEDMKTVRIDGKNLMTIFEEAGCLIGPPSCGACLGGPPDTFGRVQEPIACLSTTNRNFPGRMGHPEARIFLASPLTAAATAIRGRITDPREFV